MSVLEEFNGSISEYEYQKQQERKQERKRKRNAKIIKALEDIKAEIEKSIKESVEKTSFNGSVFRCGLHEAVEIIDRKIAEMKGD